jgi:hypothetical protein
MLVRGVLWLYLIGVSESVVELPYVPIQDEEAEQNLKVITVKLPNNTKTTITKISHSSNKELFLSRSIVVKNHVEKDLGLYAVAEELEKEMEVCQAQMEQYKQPESTPEGRLNRAKKAKYDEAVKKYVKAEKKRDKVIQKMLDTYLQALHPRKHTPYLG